MVRSEVEGNVLSRFRCECLFQADEAQPLADAIHSLTLVLRPRSRPVRDAASARPAAGACGRDGRHRAFALRPALRWVRDGPRARAAARDGRRRAVPVWRRVPLRGLRAAPARHAPCLGAHVTLAGRSAEQGERPANLGRLQIRETAPPYQQLARTCHGSHGEEGERSSQLAGVAA